MINNHREFIGAITAKKMIRVRFHAGRNQGIIDRICAPLDYGPATKSPVVPNRYWIWDTSRADASARPLGLLQEQILSVNVLEQTFDPAAFGDVHRAWSVPRSWDATVEVSS